jgi:DNA-binding response OmpR family regulator
VQSYQGAEDLLLVAAKTPAPDLVIIDYQLGSTGNGLRLYQDLQQFWPAVPALLVSAAPEPDLPARARELGMIFLAKPIKAAALRACLNSVKLSKGR